MAAELLALTGADSLPGLVSELTAEQQWRVLVAWALLPEPRVVLAEDPGLGPGTRIPGEGGLDTPSLDARGVTAIWDLRFPAPRRSRSSTASARCRPQREPVGRVFLAGKRHLSAKPTLGANLALLISSETPAGPTPAR